MKLEVVNIKGEKTGRSVELADDIFGIEPNDHVIYLDVKRIRNAQRQGTHKAKERNEIAGSTRKLHKQKGTGGSRKGDIKNPLFKGGGRIFGPKPRDYDIKLNKKERSLARKSALAYKAKEQAIFVVEDLNFAAPKTKSYIEMLNSLKIADKKTLLVLNENNDNVVLSARNVANADIAIGTELNTYNIMNANTLLIVEGAVKNLNETLK